jgi:hypothetical protein
MTEEFDLFGSHNEREKKVKGWFVRKEIFEKALQVELLDYSVTFAYI